MRTLSLVGMVMVAGAAFGAETPDAVKVHDGGPQTNDATWECTSGHQVRKQRITLGSSARKYTFLVSGCQDPSHEGKHPCAEGNFGMPDPISGNWYWGGFFRVFVNDTDATICDVKDLRVIEQDTRGEFQILWSHPEAEVGLRLMLLPGGNHVLADLVWKPTPGATVQSVRVELTCYPSFFTAARNRTGERHCQTPRADQVEPTTLELQPEQDTYLYYYDAVFDMPRARGTDHAQPSWRPRALRAGT